MSIFLGGGDDDDAATTNLRLPGPSPIAPRDRIPREGPPHFDFVNPYIFFLLKGGGSKPLVGARLRLPDHMLALRILDFPHVILTFCLWTVRGQDYRTTCWHISPLLMPPGQPMGVI